MGGSGVSSELSQCKARPLGGYRVQGVGGSVPSRPGGALRKPPARRHRDTPVLGRGPQRAVVGTHGLAGQRHPGSVCGHPSLKRPTPRL